MFNSMISVDGQGVILVAWVMRLSDRDCPYFGDAYRKLPGVWHSEYSVVRFRGSVLFPSYVYGFLVFGGTIFNSGSNFLNPLQLDMSEKLRGYG